MEDTAVILVGGLGMRLRPLTKTIPKPLLTFGNDTILEIIVSNLSKNKFTNRPNNPKHPHPGNYLRYGQSPANHRNHRNYHNRYDRTLWLDVYCSFRNTPF